MTTTHTDDLPTIARALDAATNMFGRPLSEDARARVFAAIDRPSAATWEAARGVILTSDSLTLWRAAVAATDYDGTTGTHLPPTGEQIAAALIAATLGPESEPQR